MYLQTGLFAPKVIARDKLTGVGHHWGVLRADGSVAHNTAERGVEVVPFQQFAAGKAVRTVYAVPPHEAALMEIRLHAELRTGRPYDLLTNNCETFAHRLTGRAEHSPQVKQWASLATLLGAMALLG